ncbi:MAG: hypothetical protein LBD19_03895 [Endomicrobium sp.]|jgi:ABC-type Fe3+ transport system permease subunit|nr:hypothetical protein [Endomicrobium sp.]
MKIKLISLILILCCFISVSGYGQTEGYTNEEETKQYEQEKTFFAKVKETIVTRVIPFQVLCTLCATIITLYSAWGLDDAPRNHMQWQQQWQNQRTSAQSTDMAM